MEFILWMIIIGLLLIAMAFSGTLVQRLPVSTSMLYLAVGWAIGPAGLGMLRAEPFSYAGFIERAAEIAVLISLFSSGLKLKLPLTDRRWRLSLRLAFGSMAVTVALIAAAGVVGLGLSLGAAILLGAILAPTDPVLASDVQVDDPDDADRLRFSLTSEAGLNDGAAFPFVMLGLGLLGLHEIGASGWRWWSIDLLWAVGGGLAIGGCLGWLTGKVILYLRVHHREAIGLNEFLSLGLIALSYGVALLLHTYGFLAVFAAGLALQRVSSTPTAMGPSASQTTAIDEPLPADAATNPEHASEHLTRSVLGFNEQLERIVEVALVLLVGALLWYLPKPADALWFIPLLFLVIRPISVWLGLARSHTSSKQRLLMSWFGIRGIGSIYYVFYAMDHGVQGELAEQLLSLTLIAVAVSIVVHGISVTPLMRNYRRGARKTR